MVLPMLLPFVLALGLWGPAQAAEPVANQSKQQATDKAASASSKDHCSVGSPAEGRSQWQMGAPRTSGPR